MKDQLLIINATAERIYFMTLNKYTLSHEDLALIRAETESMLMDVKDAEKEAIQKEYPHFYKRTEG